MTEIFVFFFSVDFLVSRNASYRLPRCRFAFLRSRYLEFYQNAAAL
jgi:hypothetical protein